MNTWPVMNKPLILIIGVAYLIMCIGIGFWAMRKNKSSDDFFAASKGVGSVLLVFGTFSAVMSGFGFVGGPGLSYKVGFGAMWIVMSLPMGYFICWLTVGKKFRQISNVRQILSVPDILYARFESNTLRFIAGLGIFIGALGFLASQMMATGYIMVVVFGLSFNMSLLIGLIIVGGYSIAGGVIAGLYTDVVQGIAMLGGAVAIVIICLTQMGGTVPMWEAVALENPAFTTTFGALSPMFCLSYMFAGVMGTLAQPHVVSRFFMMKDTKTLRWTAFLTALGYFVASLLILFVGSFIRAKVGLGELPALEVADTASIVFLLNYAPQFLAGIVLAGLLGAIMSTTDAFLSVGSAAVVRDMTQAITGKPMKRELAGARIVTALLLIVASLIAFKSTAMVTILGVFGWAFFSGVLGPVLVIGLNWKKTSRQGAVAGAAVGFLVTGGLQVTKALGLYAAPHGFVNGTIGFLVGTIVIIVVSLVTNSKAGKDMPEDIYEIIVS